MKKSLPIIMAAIIILAIIVAVVVVVVRDMDHTIGLEMQLPEINSAEDLSSLVDRIYENADVELFDLETRIVDVSDEVALQSYTGLESAPNIEYLVASEPMINAQPYSLVMAKVKDGTNANELAKEISESVNPRKWICVSAEKVYATSSGNIAFLIMSKEDMAKPVYESFKALAGKVGEEYEKTIEDGELPPDTTGVMEVPTDTSGTGTSIITSD